MPRIFGSGALLYWGVVHLLKATGSHESEAKGKAASLAAFPFEIH